MTSDAKYDAATFSISSCFMIISLIFAIAAGELTGFMQSLIVAALVGMVGFYNAFRALQNALND